MACKDQERQENEKVKEHLVKTKHELTDTKATLADTNDRLTTAQQRISTLKVLLYLTTNKTATRPTSRAMILESSLRWCDKLVAMPIMSKSGDQEYPVILKMPQFRKEKTKGSMWHSDPFYTHSNEYKMSLRIYAAGSGDSKGTHVSVFLCLMKGSHDDELTWPLRGKIEITLLNQFSNTESLSH